MWADVDTAAESGKLSSRLDAQRSGLSVDWTVFDGLKDALLSYISCFEAQDSSMVLENGMVLELIKLLHELVKFGFYSSHAVRPMSPTLLRVLGTI